MPEPGDMQQRRVIIVAMPEISMATAQHMARIMGAPPRTPILRRAEQLQGWSHDTEVHVFQSDRGFSFLTMSPRDVEEGHRVGRELEHRFEEVTYWDADSVVVHHAHDDALTRPEYRRE